MVIHQIDIKGVAVEQAKHDPPIPRYVDTPHSFERALQSMKAVAGQIEVRWFARPVQVSQNVLDPVHLIRTELAAIAFLEQPFEAPMPESTYQSPSVPCAGTSVKRARWAVSVREGASTSIEFSEQAAVRAPRVNKNGVLP